MNKSAGIWLLWLGLTSCTSVHTHKPDGTELVMSQEEFAQYVEAVFRHHNRVMSALIEGAGDLAELEVDESKPLKDAEDKMVSSCQPLNDIVAEEMSGEHVGVQLKLDVVDAVPACEAATLQVEDLMP